PTGQDRTDAPVVASYATSPHTTWPPAVVKPSMPQGFSHRRAPDAASYADTRPPPTTSTDVPATWSPGGAHTVAAPVRWPVYPPAAGPIARQAIVPVRPSIATSRPSDQRPTTVVPAATTPLSC